MKRLLGTKIQRARRYPFKMHLPSSSCIRRDERRKLSAASAWDSLVYSTVPPTFGGIGRGSTALTTLPRFRPSSIPLPPLLGWSIEKCTHHKGNITLSGQERLISDAGRRLPRRRMHHGGLTACPINFSAYGNTLLLRNICVNGYDTTGRYPFVVAA